MKGEVKVAYSPARKRLTILGRSISRDYAGGTVDAVVWVDLKPNYFGSVGASNYLVGSGLSGRQGRHRNLPYLGVLRAGGRRTGKRARQVR